MAVPVAAVKARLKTQTACRKRLQKMYRKSCSLTGKANVQSGKLWGSKPHQDFSPSLWGLLSRVCVQRLSNLLCGRTASAEWMACRSRYVILDFLICVTMVINVGGKRLVLVET